MKKPEICAGVVIKAGRSLSVGQLNENKTCGNNKLMKTVFVFNAQWQEFLEKYVVKNIRQKYLRNLNST